MRLARNRAVIEANTTPVSDLGVSGALALLSAPRASGDDLVDAIAGLADTTVELAADWNDIFLMFDWFDNACEQFRERKSHHAKRIAFIHEAEAICNSFAELLPLTEALRDRIDAVWRNEISPRFEAASAEAHAAFRAEEYMFQKVDSVVRDMKDAGVDIEEIICSLWLRFGAMPWPSLPDGTSAYAKFRDVIKEWRDRAGQLGQEATT
jgi:hypothetical protein